MYNFSPVDAQILLGLYSAHQLGKFSCRDVIANCEAINHSIPTAEEFAEAFNKLLYVSAIVIDGEQVRLANFGGEIVRKAKAGANPEASPGVLSIFVHKELSGYKLKSKCNRHVWTREQYQQAIDLHRNNAKP